VEREHITARVHGPEALSISGASRLNPDGVEALCIFYLGRQSLAVVRYSVRRLLVWALDALAPIADALGSRRAPTIKLAGGNAKTFTKVFIGPLPNSFPASMFVDCFRVKSPRSADRNRGKQSTPMAQATIFRRLARVGSAARLSSARTQRP
jgi:hypothetical protein